MHLYIGWDVGCVGRSVRRFGQIGLVHRGCHAENRFLFRRCPGRSERQIGRKSSRQRTGHSDLRHQIPVGHGQISYQAITEKFAGHHCEAGRVEQLYFVCVVFFSEKNKGLTFF